ncbi:hypothetical protein KAW50_08150 [candidate division WOR-3 bacterium]|nr:hypothetical protein [candidate division WOR-3 bacterium]
MKDISKVMQFLLDKGNANFRRACMRHIKDHFVLDSSSITINDLKIPNEKRNQGKK